MVAPAGTPLAIIARINREFVAVMKMPEVIQRINAVALEPLPTTPEEFATFIRVETAKWGRVICEGNVKAE